MSKTITFDKLGDAIAEELSLYGDTVINGVKKEAKKSMSRLVKETKATAPVGRRRKHYRDSITSKKLEETGRTVSYLWYVKGSDYRLSHLLENGHALHWGGRVEGTHFIKKASDPILEQYYQAVEEVIKNG